MPTAPRMNRPQGYSFQDDTLLPLLSLARQRAQQTLSQPGLLAAAPAATYGLLSTGDTATRQGLLDTAAIGPQGDIVGPIADLHRFATDPSSRTWGDLGLFALGLAPGAPAVGSMTRKAGKLPMDEASRAVRAKEMGHERGFWHGGAAPADTPWYARTKERAAEFDRGDLREYSLKMDNPFRFSDSYGGDDLNRIADALRGRGYDQTAKYLPDIAEEFGGKIPARHLMQIINQATSDHGWPVLAEAGFDVLDMGGDLVVTHGKGVVRDAATAAYDFAKKNSPDIFAGLLAPAVGLGAYGLLSEKDDSL